MTALLLLLACCTHDGDAQAEPNKPQRPKDSNMSTDSPLKWTLAISPDKRLLIVDVTFHNTLGKKIYLADKQVTSAPGNKFARSPRITVMGGDDPTVASFTLGVTGTDRPTTALYEPTYQLVEPGATVKRHFEVPMPLSSWHPQGGANPLSGKVKSAVLSVQGFFGEPARWTTLATDDPEPIRSPELTQDRQVFTAGPTPIPL